MNLYSFSIILLGLLLHSCSNAQDSSDSKIYDKLATEDSLVANIQIIDKRTYEEKALDALNDIQTSGATLYSTFPNIVHNECKGAISNYEISNEDFEDALLVLLNQKYNKLTPSERDYLASTSSKAQSEYKLITCGSTIDSAGGIQNTVPPRNGTWVFPAILGQRDLVIIW